MNELYKLEQDPRSKQDLQRLVNHIAWKIKRIEAAKEAAYWRSKCPLIGTIIRPTITFVSTGV